MFLYYYIHLPQPFEAAERKLLALLGGLDGPAAEAYRDGETIHAKLAVDGTRLVAKTVSIHFGPPLRSPDGTDIPLTWEATGPTGLFPKLEGDLVMAPLGESMTQLCIRGSYKPPLGALGRALDRTMLHRVAEASVKSFVDRIGRSIEQASAGDGASAVVNE
jgi:hypothetical protein